MSNVHRDAKEAEAVYPFLSKKLSKDNLSQLSCNIMMWNVWSILNPEKLRSVLQVLEDNQIQIACITETWFDAEKGIFTSAIKSEGYEIIHSPRSDKRGGGTAIIYKNNLKVKKGASSSSKYESFEFSYVYLKNQGTRIVLLCIYRKQEVACKIFCRELEELMDDVSNTTEALLVMGDFNVWVDVESNSDAKKLTTLMSAYGLSQLIKESTHKEGHTLDHLYHNEHMFTLSHTVHKDTFGISTDHLPCIVTIPCERKEEQEITRMIRKIKNMDLETFKQNLDEIVNNVITSDDNFERTYEKFKQETENLLNKHCPLEPQKVKRSKGPEWMDEEYKIARAARRKLDRIWKKTKSEEDHQRYIDQRTLCAQLAISKQERHFSKVIDSAENKQKSLFKVVDKLLDKKDERILPVHTDPVALADNFNKYYIDKIDKLRESIPASSDFQLKRPKFDGIKLEVFDPTTEDEIKEILNENGIKTSCEDPLPVAILKEVKDEMLPALVVLVNKSLSEGSMEGIKSSVIDPLLKKAGLDSEIYKNYRPVNDLVFLSKLTERIVKRRIDAHMETNNLHNKKAFGYKTGHSTETMMLGVTSDVLNGFDQNKCTVMMFLDLSAAFDTIDIDKLLEILRDEIGLHGKALEWCKSFLTKRTQRVKINDQFSEKLEVKYGSVQGSVLGPKFFNIYVRSQPQVFEENGFETSAFADDSNGSKTFAIQFQYNILKNDVAKCIEQVVKWSNSMFFK